MIYWAECSHLLWAPAFHFWQDQNKQQANYALKASSYFILSFEKELNETLVWREIASLLNTKPCRKLYFKKKLKFFNQLLSLTKGCGEFFMSRFSYKVKHMFILSHSEHSSPSVIWSDHYLVPPTTIYVMYLGPPCMLLHTFCFRDPPKILTWLIYMSVLPYRVLFKLLSNVCPCCFLGKLLYNLSQPKFLLLRLSQKWTPYLLVLIHVLLLPEEWQLGICLQTCLRLSMYVHRRAGRHAFPALGFSCFHTEEQGGLTAELYHQI